MDDEDEQPRKQRRLYIDITRAAPLPLSSSIVKNTTVGQSSLSKGFAVVVSRCIDPPRAQPRCTQLQPRQNPSFDVNRANQRDVPRLSIYCRFILGGRAPVDTNTSSLMGRWTDE